MSEQNLSVKLFKPKFKHPETSTLIAYREAKAIKIDDNVLSGSVDNGWYRMINRLMWIWRGVPALEIEEVLSRIAASKSERSYDCFLDTVIGYHCGNWTYEWSQLAMQYQRKALEFEQGEKASHAWLQAANVYSIAAYPHLKGDELAQQAEVLASKAYEHAARFAGFELRKIEFKMEQNGSVYGLLHLPPDISGPAPTVIMCGSLDNLQIDYFRYFSEYLAPRGIAMLTLDMPSMGYSARQKLCQESSLVHQQVLAQLKDVPWIDHTRVAAFGFRFGANVAIRLAYLESKRLKGVAVISPIVHELLTNKKTQQNVPIMYMDVLASRIGLNYLDANSLNTELCCYSLKNQGLLGKRCSIPLLSMYWDKDIFSPKSESQLIARSSYDGKMIKIENTSAERDFTDALTQAVDWLDNLLK